MRTPCYRMRYSCGNIVVDFGVFLAGQPLLFLVPVSWSLFDLRQKSRGESKPVG